MFQLSSEYSPRGDQPQAIAALTDFVREGRRHMVLRGVTGSGKTYTMANVIANVDRPTLVISPNKTLAAQLYGEFKAFFPHNAVEYFVSYYDYYQPEAYIPQSDTYIEKDALINDEIDRMRHSATRSLMERRGVVVGASVSCIYRIGAPRTYPGMDLSIPRGGQGRGGRRRGWGLPGRAHPPPGGGAARAAPPLRQGDCARVRLLPRHRKLPPPSQGPAPGRGPADAHRVPAQGRARHHRREPRGRAADPGDVLRRSLAQGGPRRVRVPPAVGLRQPAADLRRIHPARRSDP